MEFSVQRINGWSVKWSSASTLNRARAPGPNVKFWCEESLNWFQSTLYQFKHITSSSVFIFVSLSTPSDEILKLTNSHFPIVLHLPPNNRSIHRYPILPSPNQKYIDLSIRYLKSDNKIAVDGEIHQSGTLPPFPKHISSIETKTHR